MPIKSDDQEGKREVLPPLPLTLRQHQLMLAVQHHIASQGVSPTYDELRTALGLASRSAVKRLVDGCIERGRLAVLPRRQRSIVVLAPVEEGLGAARPPSLTLSSFNDGALLAELARRGLLRSV